MDFKPGELIHSGDHGLGIFLRQEDDEGEEIVWLRGIPGQYADMVVDRTFATRAGLCVRVTTEIVELGLRAKYDLENVL